MKLTIINDCAFSGETLLKFLPETVEATHIKRTRGLFDKTLALAYKIYCAEADVYHVHYLLQDCYLALLLEKKPLIAHAHGSDLRTTLNRFFYGKIVKYNLKNCTWLFVSTPDLVDLARKYRDQVEYLPNTVDTSLFYYRAPRSHRKIRVLIAGASNRETKNVANALRALSQIKDKVHVSIIKYGLDFQKNLILADILGLDLTVLPKVPNTDLKYYFWDSDIIIDQFTYGVLGKTGLEAISSGRPLISYVSSAYPEFKDFPLLDVNSHESIREAVLLSRAEKGRLWRAQQKYLEVNHKPSEIVSRVLEVYRECLKEMTGPLGSSF